MTTQTDKEYEQSGAYLNEKDGEERERRHEAHEKAEDQFHKSRMPLYVIVGVAFLIGLINGMYIGSDVVFLMCLIFGGGTFAYLWFTRRSGPDLPKTGERIYDPTRKGHDR